MKKYPNTEFTRKAVCLFLHISYHKVHNVNHKQLAENMITKATIQDPQNLLSREDYKIIMHYMIELIKESNQAKRSNR